MNNKLFDLLNIATTLLTHVYADIESGDPLFKDVETALNALKSASQASAPKSE